MLVHRQEDEGEGCERRGEKERTNNYPWKKDKVFFIFILLWVASEPHNPTKYAALPDSLTD